MNVTSHEIRHVVRFGEKTFTAEQLVADGSIVVQLFGFAARHNDQTGEIVVTLGVEEAAVIAEVMEELAKP